MNNTLQEKVSIKNKFALTVKEAAEYFNIGEHRIRELTDKKDCPFVLWVGSKRLVKRKKFEEYLSVQYSV
ncbi:MAG: helix-turn-helix domain-containing protein [Firmicutes bacterium]|nr:helix-turn-helix domain-containing protein [Bacillota bacterium]